MTLGGRLLSIDRPWVMGIVNATPDSFYASSRCIDEAGLTAVVRGMVADGVDVLDLGACSTRPGATVPDAATEMSRLRLALTVARREAPDTPLSVDTFRADVARMAVEEFGPVIINDISGGTLDPDMVATVAHLSVPYVTMHMRGTPATMQELTQYDNVVAEVLETLARQVDSLHQAGVNDVLADPGFGFAKTIDQNYALLAALPVFHHLDVPLLVGLSRKRMVQQALGCDADHALNGSVVLATAAMLAGVHVVRTHDVRPTVEACRLVSRLRAAQPQDAPPYHPTNQSVAL